MSRLKRLIVEVHQRSLWQVFLVYVGAAWACFELIDGVTERLGLPAWLPGLAIVLFLLGLPFVVATALIREDVLPSGAEERPGEAVSPAVSRQATTARRRFLTWRNALASLVVALAVWGVVAGGWLLFGKAPGPAGDERSSIAVLPFENLSPDPDDAYFADGIHEEIISQLGGIGALKVISRTSVMEYRDRAENLRTIADQLGVTHVLEGSVRRAGDRVRITTQLIQAKDDEHLWAESYERELSDIFAIQADVARQVTAALRASLTPREAEQIEAKPTENLEAYGSFLLGSAHAQRGTWDELVLAEECYERAVQIDTTFAVAWAALAQLRVAMLWSGGTERPLWMAENALQRAVELGADLPETHLAQGYYQYHGKRDYEPALEEFAFVLRDRPSSSEALAAIAYIRRRQGRWEEAVSGLENAAQLDPRNVGYQYELANTNLMLKNYEETERYVRRALSIEPTHVGTHQIRVLLPLLRGRGIAEAREVLRASFDAVGAAELVTSVARVYAYSPYWRVMILEFEEALRDSTVVEQLRRACPACYFNLMADIATYLGEEDVAVAYIDSAYARYVAALEMGEEAGSYYPVAWRNLGRHAAQLGRREEAIEAAEKAVRLLPVARDAMAGPAVVQSLAEVYLLVGEHEAAIDQLEYLLSIPSDISAPLLSLDPLWHPIRDHPRFQALLARYDVTP